jgi:hypothetical protein
MLSRWLARPAGAASARWPSEWVVVAAGIVQKKKKKKKKKKKGQSGPCMFERIWHLRFQKAANSSAQTVTQGQGCPENIAPSMHATRTTYEH